METVLATSSRHLVRHNRHCTASKIKTPRLAIDQNFDEILEYLPLQHIIWDLGQKHVLSKYEVEKINKDKHSGYKFLRVLRRHKLDVYLAFCKSAEDSQSTVTYNHTWVIYDMRRALDSANYAWQWLHGENVIKKSCQHFTNEMACTLDGWKNKPAMQPWEPGKMLIINYTPRNKLIGVVNEVGNWALHVREGKDSTSDEHVVKRQKTDGVGFETLFSKMVEGVTFAVVERANCVGIEMISWILYNQKYIQTVTGVHLPLPLFVRMMWLQDQVADAMKDMNDGKIVEKSLHVGGGVRLLICSPSPTVHIQQYERDYKTFKQTNGIIVTYTQWSQLLDIAHNDANLEEILPHLKYITPCYTHYSHQSQRRVACEDCNFFTGAEEKRFSLPGANTGRGTQPPVAAKTLTKKRMLTSLRI